MKKMILAGVALTAVNLAGCGLSDTVIIPQGNGTYQMVSTAYSERDAIQGGINKANDLCQEQGKKAVVLNTKTIYQGVDKTTGAVTDTLSQLATNMNNTKDSRTTFAPSTRRSDDYRTTLVFKCQ